MSACSDNSHGCDLCGVVAWTARVGYGVLVLHLCRVHYSLYLSALFPKLVHPGQRPVVADMRHAWATS